MLRLKTIQIAYNAFQLQQYSSRTHYKQTKTDFNTLS